jgi:hypothetical protein
MISPIRRMAHSFSTKAYDSSLLLDQLGGEVELLLFAPPTFALIVTLASPGLLVAADHHQLLAGEQVVDLARIDAIDRRARPRPEPSTSNSTLTSVITGSLIRLYSG